MVAAHEVGRATENVVPVNAEHKNLIEIAASIAAEMVNNQKESD
jgi:hypothetical protein